MLFIFTSHRVEDVYILKINTEIDQNRLRERGCCRQKKSTGRHATFLLKIYYLMNNDTEKPIHYSYCEETNPAYYRE